MRKALLLAALSLCAAEAFSQVQREAAFRSKYELKEVVVMSRHNIRSPLTSGGAGVTRVTPHEWFKWTAPSSQLSLRGGVLETEMGQFFRKWVVDNGLLPDNYRPTGTEVRFYANSRQRTFATAKYFSAGFLPFANVEIEHTYDEDKMDPVFTPQFTKMNATYRQQVSDEINAMNGGPKAMMDAIADEISLLEDVLEISKSPAAAKGDTTHLTYDDTQFVLEKGSEPKMKGGYTLINSVADALVLQFYETEGAPEAAFGKTLTEEQWKGFGKVKAVYDNLLFTTKSAAVNLAYPLVSLISEELRQSGRKFTFLCGHDSNLASIGSALDMQFPEAVNAVETHTPIGSKIVFEKWTDGTTEYVAVNLVYQAYSQLQGRTLLNLDTPPMVLPITFAGLTQNADGLYLLDDVLGRFEEAKAAYDAIEDEDATALDPKDKGEATRPQMLYNLAGQVVAPGQRGLGIAGGKKVLMK